MSSPTPFELFASVIESGALRKQRARLRALPDAHVILICDCAGRLGHAVGGMFDAEAYGSQPRGDDLWVCAIRWSLWKEVDFCRGLENFGPTAGRDRFAIITRADLVFTGTLSGDGEDQSCLVIECGKGVNISDTWQKYLDDHPGHPN